MFWRVCARRPPITPLSSTRRQPVRKSYEWPIVPSNRVLVRHFSVKSYGLFAAAGSDSSNDFLSEYKNSFQRGPLHDTFYLGNPDRNREYIGKPVTVHGYLGKRKDLSEKLSFVQLGLAREHGSGIQVVSRVQDSPIHEDAATSEDVHRKLKNTRPHSAVSVSAVLEQKRQPNRKNALTHNSKIFAKENLELVLQDITCLAEFPDDIIVSDRVQFGPENRHLQLRFDQGLQKRLRVRDSILRQCRAALEDFQEIETPILFKSTPEGAREFLVPTRKPGYAYALPQSPQQYKQILMASGIYRYFQIAKCFRDEDLRADRQPEFTQVDLEMAFSDGERVMNRTERFLYNLIEGLAVEIQQEELVVRLPAPPFPRLTYYEAMRKYGSDKPDLRIPGEIHQIDGIMPRDLVAMLSPLPDPVVECWRLQLDCKPSAARSFIQGFMDSSEATLFQQNPDGAPGVFISDSRRPLEGLQAFGHEGANALKMLYSNSSSNVEPFEQGDLIIVQARPRTRHSGGSTVLGRLRAAIHKAAISEGLAAKDEKDYFLWVTDFPLFTPNNETDPGQGGSAGFFATHHPFTAPKTARDVDLLITNPLEAIADHYDLVVNGVELGGGSRRIHNSEMQLFVMKDVLKMSDERLDDFSHLFKVLRAGCPPHAGIALGLDRLIAVMLGVDSVRDVIAFPKGGKGEDLLVNSPRRMTQDQQETYHFTVSQQDII